MVLRVRRRMQISGLAGRVFCETYCITVEGELHTAATCSRFWSISRVCVCTFLCRVGVFGVVLHVVESGCIVVVSLYVARGIVTPKKHIHLY